MGPIAGWRWATAPLPNSLAEGQGPSEAAGVPRIAKGDLEDGGRDLNEPRSIATQHYFADSKGRYFVMQLEFTS